MTIAFEEGPKDTNYFKPFLTSLAPDYEENVHPNGENYLEMFPRSNITSVTSYILLKFHR